MKYAVIQLAGKQYKVAEGESLTVNSLGLQDGETLSITDVLLTADGTKVEVGTPVIKGKTVKLKVVSSQKGAKLRVATYKAKSRYRRVHGHRQHETTVEVVSIS
jgi:large subunit ribosomal protein L21